MEDHDGDEPAPPGSGWFKSQHSAATCTCVEVRFLADADAVQVRDSKQISAITGENVSEIITLPAADWRQFIGGVADEAARTTGPLVRYSPDDNTIVLHCTESGVELTYDSDEWEAFRSGVLDGEFDPPAPVNP